MRRAHGKISLGCDRILCLLDVPGERKSVGHAVKKIRVSHADFFLLCVPLGSQKLRERFLPDRCFNLRVLRRGLLVSDVFLSNAARDDRFWRWPVPGRSVPFR